MNNMPTEEAREARARRAAARQGVRLHRSLWRAGTIDNMGGYMLIDNDNIIVAGERFNLDLGDVEAWLND